MEIPSAVQQAQKAVVRIIDSDSGSGTGFFITPNTVVTNRHVVMTEIIKGVKEQDIHVENRSMRIKVKRVKNSSEKNDLALLEVKKTSISPLEMMTDSNGIEGERFYIVGHPDGGRLKILSAKATKEQERGTIFLYTDQMNFLPGLSGSPILNGQGKVVGVLYAKASKEDKFNAIGIRVEYLKQLLGRKSFDWYIEEASNLNIQAINWLQRRAEKGDTRAKNWFRETFMFNILKAVDTGEFPRNIDLGDIPLRPNAVTATVRRDTCLSVWDWFTGIAGEGDVQALGWLGRLLKNSDTVHSWFTKEVREGSRPVLDWLAGEAEMGDIKSLELLIEGANQGNRQALEMLQKMASRPGDNTYISEWLRQVANPENIEMMNWLKEQAQTGNTRVQNWFKENRDSNISDLNPFLQQEAEKGGVQALNWLKRMANRGDVQALNWLQKQGKKGNDQVLKWFREEAYRGNPIILYWMEHRGQLGNIRFINALLNHKEMNIYTNRVWQNEKVQNWFKEEAKARNPLARKWLLQQAIKGNHFALEWLKEEWRENNVQIVEAIKKTITVGSSRIHNEVIRLLQIEAEKGHIQSNELLMKIANSGNVQAIKWIFQQSEHDFAMLPQI